MLKTLDALATLERLKIGKKDATAEVAFYIALLASQARRQGFEALE